MGRKTVAEPSLQAAVCPAGPDQSSVILAESSSLRTTSWEVSPWAGAPLMSDAVVAVLKS